MILRSVEQN